MLHHNVPNDVQRRKTYQVRNIKWRAQRVKSFNPQAPYLFALAPHCLLKSKTEQNTHLLSSKTSEISLVFFSILRSVLWRSNGRLDIFPLVCDLFTIHHFIYYLIHYFILFIDFICGFFFLCTWFAFARLTRGGEFRTLSTPGGLMSSGSSGRRGDRWIKARRLLLTILL